MSTPPPPRLSLSLLAYTRTFIFPACVVMLCCCIAMRAEWKGWRLSQFGYVGGAGSRVGGVGGVGGGVGVVGGVVGDVGDVGVGGVVLVLVLVLVEVFFFQR